MLDKKCYRCQREWKALEYYEDCPFCVQESTRRNLTANIRLLNKLQEQLNKEYPWHPELDHTGIMARRIGAIDARGIAESVYREEWAKENERISFVNGGFTALELLLTEDRAPYELCGGGRFLRLPDQRDATVAATIVQWLGTNGGQCFVRRCEGIIAKRIENKEAIENVRRRRKPKAEVPHA